MRSFTLAVVLVLGLTASQVFASPANTDDLEERELDEDFDLEERGLNDLDELEVEERELGDLGERELDEDLEEREFDDTDSEREERKTSLQRDAEDLKKCKVAGRKQSVWYSCFRFKECGPRPITRKCPKEAKYFDSKTEECVDTKKVCGWRWRWG